MVKRIAIYPGSFDPMTLGHLDVLQRAAKLFDEVVVGVGVNSQKPTLFSTAERVEMIELMSRDFGNVMVRAFSGLVVDFAKDLGACAMIRGLRSEADFSFEMPMAQMNRQLAKHLEVLFMPTTERYCYISSSLVREVAAYKGDVSPMVPALVADKLAEKFQGTKTC